jgi:hypothetical protein
MLGIQATGNWGYFNVGYILLCACLLDTHASILDWTRAPWQGTFWQGTHGPVNALMIVMFVTSLLYLVVADSWTGRTVIHLDLDRYVWNRGWARALLRYLRAIAPFRIVNGYGVFAPHSDAPMRLNTVFEGSDDGGATWKAYRFKFMPTRATDRPPFVAPHHPRFDMASYYAALGGHDASFYGAYIGDGTPYTSWARSSGLDRAAQRLLEHAPLTLRQIGENPFPHKPPELVRVIVQAMTPASLSHHRATGEWWHVRKLGVYVPARARVSWPERYTYPVPELFHPDWVGFKRRTPALQAIVRAHRDGLEPDQAILQGCSDLTAADVRAFWEEFVPALHVARGDFTRHEERAEAVLAQFGVDGIVKNERILERLAWLLRARTERYQWADSKPTIPIESTFRFHMFLHELVTDGREPYLALLAHPENTAARAESSTDALQLWTLTMLRHDLVMAHVCVFRWLKMMADAHEYKIPGIFEYVPLLTSLVPPGEVHRPHTRMLPDGEHVIEGLYPPPEAGAIGAPARS